MTERDYMDVHAYNFDDLAQKEWNYPKIDMDARGTQLLLKATSPYAAIGRNPKGGRIKMDEIDRIAKHPDAKSVSIGGLQQDTFEYFIKTYGRQFRYISFFDNALVEDWSLLETLPELEALYWFHNQRITKLWDMSKSVSLRALEISDFCRLRDLTGIEKAPALEWFGFGDAVWRTSELDSLKPLAGTNIRRLSFTGKTIGDMDISFIPQMKTLEVFDFPTNLFTMEEVAWLVGKCPNVEGYALRPYIETNVYNNETNKADIPGVLLVGKRKPMIAIEGNEKRIANHVAKFNKIVEENRK